MEEEVTQLREYWLRRATAFLIAHMVRCGLAAVTVRVSCGWPSRGGMGQGNAVIGQCFPPTMCKDGIPQIFVSPRIAESIPVLGTLLHELVHASVGCQYGHRKEFSQAAKKVGLDGPPTATVVGAALLPLLSEYLNRVGPYPHAAIAVQRKEKAGSRLRLYECECEPAVKVRVASDDYRAKCLRCGGLFTSSVASS